MKQRRELKLKVSIRRVTWITSIFVAVLATGLTVFFNFSSRDEAKGAVTGDFRSAGSGNWNAVATWQKYNGSSWVSATATPSSTDNIITIQSGHTVTITAGTTIDQVVVNSGGTLVQNAVTVVLNNGTGNEIDVYGTYKNAGTVTINTGSTINYQNGGKYQHNFTTSAGTIPAATWNSNSICEIIGYTSNNATPSGLAQSFGDFTWNCASQVNIIDLGSNLTTITGDLTITSTGTTGTLKISKNNASTLNVSGNFTLTAGSFTLSEGGSITSVMNVSGNYTQTSGTFTVVEGSGSTGNINVSGNYTHTAGTLTVGAFATTSAVISFARSGTQSFTVGTPIVTNNVDFKVNSGSTLAMGTNVMTGRNFTLSAGGALELGSLLGITSSGLTGNIQVSGTRSFNTGADYTFNGGSTQVFGNGFPTTVRNLTINSGGTFTIASNYTVTGTLTLTNGKINTGSNKIIVSNSSEASVAGFSSTNYIIGTLDRTVMGTGIYSFPLGSSSKYELIILSLSGTTGFTRVNGKFTSTDPNSATYDVDSIEVNGVNMSELLNYGYWTLTPNSTLTGGTFGIEAYEEGYSNTITDGTIFSLLSRPNTTTDWSAAGTQYDYDQMVVGTSVKSKATELNSFGIFAIGLGEFAAFSNVVLNSGTAGMVGAVYIFPRVIKSVDAWVEITKISGGVTLNSIDNETGIGYTPSFQPFIDYPANTSGFTAYIEWKIKFKKTGTSTDTTLAKLTATGLDVDGYSSSGSGVREYISASMPYSYNLDPYTDLTVTNDSGRYRALGGINDLTGIDSTKKQAMYELNYRNVNTIMYRTGALNTTSGSTTRQTSLFFKAFNLANKNIALPVKLISFDAISKEGTVNLHWTTASEVNNDYFTIERSTDGEKFEPLFTRRGAGNSTIKIEYEANDPNPPDGYSYYRLKQTDYDGHFSYSSVKTVKNKSGSESDIGQIQITSVSPNPFTDEFKIDFIVKQKTPVEISMISSKGESIFNDKITADDGYNSYTFTDSKGISPGYYFVSISYKNQKVTKKILKN